MYTKEIIFNLALSALLLQRQISNAETDKSNEAAVLRTHWDTALRTALEDMDLDSTSMPATLELLKTDPDDYWKFVYKYPNNCAFLRRIQSPVLVDNRASQIHKRVGLYDHEGTVVRAIFTNCDQAVAEIIPFDFPLTALSANAGLAIANKLAFHSSSLIVGKGAAKLTEEIFKKYVTFKAEAQEKDRNENFNFEDPSTESEWARERTS